MSYQNRYEPRYDPTMERRSNPHHPEYDPRFDPSAPPPTYQRFPQPQYDRNNQYGYQRNQPRVGQRHLESERYQEKKFDYRLDDRYHKPNPNQPAYHSQPPPRQQDYYDSPQQSYRSGPGNYQDSSRDDGTEDARRYDDIPRAGRANNYNTRITDLLTSIQEPETKDETFHRMMETNKGYLVMMRFRPNDLSEVITAIQESLSTLAAHHGYVIGFSEPRDMQILIPSHQMMANDQWWDPRSNQSSRYAVCCFWFKDIFQAKRWFESSKRIRQPDFPNSSPYQVVAVPLTYGRNKEPMPFGPETEEVTLLWSEYPNIYERYENDFLVNYSEPARHFMKSYGANPNVSVCRYKAGWPAEPNKYGQPGYARFDVHHERVGRAIRTGWVAPETFVTVSTFPSMASVVHFYRSQEYQNIRSNLNRYSDPVFVAITLRKVKGTSRG